MQFTHTVRPRRANRRRKAKIKADLQQQEPTHQMTLRQMDNLNFDGNITSISASEVQMPDLTEEVPINTLWAYAEGFVEYVPINSPVQVSDRRVLYGMSQRELSKEKTDSETTPMDYTCTSGTSMRESTSASGSQDLSSQQSASTISAPSYRSSTPSSSENPALVIGKDDELRQGSRKGVRKLTDEEEAALVSGQEEGAPKKTEREQSGSPQEEGEKMELDVAVGMGLDVELEIKDVAIIGNGVEMEELEEEEVERRVREMEE
ncbi:MAG: hypothetical protein GY821_04190, partial [Gammaproteobacteria bacterium]|nr:hypothetical protein [Gammaproteobacteria bacterium]